MTIECEVVEFHRDRIICPVFIEGKNLLQENDEILRGCVPQNDSVGLPRLRVIGCYKGKNKIRHLE